MAAISLKLEASLSNWIGIVSTFFVLIFLCVLLQRVYFHPLSRFPGPFLARFTDLYAAYHGFKGDVHLDVQRCHERYGKFVRYGPNRLLINSRRGMTDIYGYLKNVQKSKAYLPMVPEGEGWSTLTTIDKLKHRCKRRLLSAGLGEESLQDFQSMMLNHIDLFCRKLGEGSGPDRYNQPRNMMNWCEFLTMDIIGEFGFGQMLNMLDSNTNHFIMKILHDYSWMMGFYEQMPILSKLRLDDAARRLLSQSIKQRRWTSWCSEFSTAVLTPNLPGNRGIFSKILSAKDLNGLPFKRSELWAEGSFLMLAGSDTSATTLAALFFYLAHSSTVYNKVVTEVRSTFSSRSDIRTGTKLLSCKYLQACITEAMRISPSTPGIPYREVLPGGLLVNGIELPEGVDVGTCIYALHHSPIYFEEPESYIPERWIRGDDKESDKRLDRQYSGYIPFSVGPRSCPGRGLALMEVSLTLARVLWDLDLKLADGETGRLGEGRTDANGGRGRVGEYQLRTHVTASSDGPMLVFKKRDFSTM